ncbi:hypothetical protein [Ulvibacter antarcticus]|uniref:Uncharacterized protein n=1 Tax=Ulvibacter antarcticus TaxID=442714 RepID=A0A3L9YH98_9FLAO|nr:hypothetical protein [Ulvibacter antarcticus]RMA57268.1 hypothetical protein BXY75_3155 [Ulvibacter antarcticus]
MRTVKQIFGIALLAATTLTSCSKDKIEPDVIIPLVYPSTQDFNNIKNQALADLVQNATFNAEDGLSFTSIKGTQVFITAGCLMQGGSPATGAAELTFVEVFDKASMLTANKATMGVLPGGDRGMIISGGEFYINVKQNGNQLDLTCPMSVIIDASLTGGADPAMTLWDGDVDENGNIVWREQDGTGAGGVQGDGSEYYANFPNFGWTNVDRFYSDPRPKTTLGVKVPVGYDDANSAVFLSYDGEDNAIAALDTFDHATSIFSEHYGQIPVGLEMHVIFATENEGDWSWAIMGVTVAADDLYDFTGVALTTGSQSQLEAAILALP